MNASQRKTLEKATAILEDQLSIITSERDAEQEKFDNMPEPLQNSEKGETMQAGIDTLDEVIESLEAATEALGNIG